MKIYKCDFCEEISSPEIKISGELQTKKGNILLPRHEFHFCSQYCFNKYIEKYLMTCAEKVKNKAPWPDFKGNPIFEGDIIQHPDGKTGIVFYDSNKGGDEGDKWLVNYDIFEMPSKPPKKRPPGVAPGIVWPRFKQPTKPLAEGEKQYTNNSRLCLQIDGKGQACVIE